MGNYVYKKEIPAQDVWYWIRYRRLNSEGVSELTECIGEVHQSLVSKNKLVTFRGMTCMADERFEFAGPISKPVSKSINNNSDSEYIPPLNYVWSP